MQEAYCSVAQHGSRTSFRLHLYHAVQHGLCCSHPAFGFCCTMQPGQNLTFQLVPLNIIAARFKKLGIHSCIGSYLVLSSISHPSLVPGQLV